MFVQFFKEFNSVIGSLVLTGVAAVDDNDINFIKKLLLVLKDQIRNDNQKEESGGVPNTDDTSSMKPALVPKGMTPVPITDVTTKNHVPLSTEVQTKSMQIVKMHNTEGPTTTGSPSDVSLTTESQLKSKEIFFVHDHVRSHHTTRNNTFEWFSSSGRDFHGWRDEFSFPGSDFVLNMIDSYLINGLYLESTIRGRHSLRFSMSNPLTVIELVVQITLWVANHSLTCTSFFYHKTVADLNQFFIT